MLINGIPLFVTIDREKYKDRFHQLDAKEGLMLLKQRSVIEKEAAIAVPHRPHLLEMGIYKGGSVILYDQLFEPDRLVAVELDRNRIPALDQYIQTNRRSERVKPYFGINQASKTQMTALLSANFPKRDIHLVIDDASHFYEETRNALDLVFPYMAAGSAYVIEDWGWAHWASRVWTNPYFDNKLPLTNLIFELVSLCATEPEIVSSVDISPSMTVVHRGKKSVRDGWSIRDCCSWREGILQQIP